MKPAQPKGAYHSRLSEAVWSRLTVMLEMTPRTGGRDVAGGLTAPRKQQHRARRVLARLVDEHAVMDVSYWTVRDYVARRRPVIAAEGGRQLEQAFVPQSHVPGAEGEVDFADLGWTCPGPHEGVPRSSTG